MSKTKFVGDIHGDLEFLPLLDEGDIPCIQLGDLNLFGYDNWYENNFVVKQYNFKKKVWFIEGNHEAFEKLNPDNEEPYELVKNLIHIPRGFVSGKTLFVGGGDSPPFDRIHRTAGRDWWSEEAISQSQFDRIMNLDTEIEAIITHDAPEFMVPELIKDKFGNYTLYKLPTSIALEQIFDKFKPKLWIGGHYHRSYKKEHKGCQFNFLGIGETRELDVPIQNDFFEKY